MKANTPLELYKTLADQSRLRLINILSHGHFNVQEMTTILGISQPTVSYHLRLLDQVEIVTSRKEGSWVYYALRSVPESPLPAGTIAVWLRDKAHSDPIFGEDAKRAREALVARRSKTQRYFESIAPSWDQLRKSDQLGESFVGQLAKLIHPSASFLELGCGSGALLEKILPRPGKTIGVDYSQPMLDEAAACVKRCRGTVDLRFGYLEQLPVKDASIDIAAFHMVLHHSPQPPDALADVFRVLRKDGQLLIVDLKKHDHEYMRERFADVWLGFDPKQLKRWAIQCGFRNGRFKTLGRTGHAFLASFVK